MIMGNALNQITNISDNDEINYKNYMDSLNFISNLYDFVQYLDNQKTVPLTKIMFLPSFVSDAVANEIGMTVEDSDTSKMKIFKISSKLFSEEENRKVVINSLNPICESITQTTENVIIFKLK